jgi:hypothetical protein
MNRQSVTEKKVIRALLVFIILAFLSGAAHSTVNTLLPESVRIKTPTQTFNRYYYFALMDGRIYCKPNLETTGKKDEWELFLETGLPHDSTIVNYPVPSSIAELHADADEIVAISDAGRIYWLRLETGVSWDAKVWNCLWGWPDPEPLFLKGRAVSSRAWAIGRRNRDVLYHEDIDGNPHHFGTMGITSLYVLNRDGREIYYTDSGLPADFSHTITLPKRGRFVAEALSASASTLFVIDAAGKMYTRLVDFDTIGSDPMFFKYSYRREKRKEHGEDWASNFTAWSLPAEQWRPQPDIELLDRAQISSMITILQNGHGNSARELRVAGTNREGDTGYYRKMIFDGKWEFVAYPVALDEAKLLRSPGTQPDRITGNDAQNNDVHYFGRIRKNGSYVPNTSVELLDFNLAESPATLRITDSGVVTDITLHTAEAWTYLIRNDPGRDGTPKIFLGTLEINGNEEPQGLIAKELQYNHLETFRFIVEATKEHVYIRPRSSLYGDMEFILSAQGVPFRNTMAVRTYAMAQNGFDRIANADELKMDSLGSRTKADIPLLKQKIELNRAAMKQIDSIIGEIKKSSKRIRKTSVIYTALSTIAHATGLVLVDKPKIWTATRHFGTLLKGYAESYEFLYFTGKQTHEDAIKKLNKRINAYAAKIGDLEGESESGIFFSENYCDYFYRLGMSNSELVNVLYKDYQAFSDISPVEAGHSFFFIHIGHKDAPKVLTLQVRLPKLEEEMSGAAPDGSVVFGKFQAKIYLFESNGSDEAAVLYENIFSRHFSTYKNADEIKAYLQVDKRGWQIFDISGLQKNQIWVKNINE